MTNMTRNTLTSALVLATAIVGTGASVQAQEGLKTQHVIKTTVVSARQASNVDLGSKKALGFYGKSNGQCDLTVMVVDNTPGKASETNSASRLQVSVKPGATVRIDSVEGRTVAYFCGSGARRMTVMTLGPWANTPRS